MEAGTNLDFFYRWATTMEPAPYMLESDPSKEGAVLLYTAWAKHWPANASTTLNADQIAAVRAKIPKRWVQGKDIRRKINEMEETATRLAEKYPLLGDYLNTLSRVLKALQSVMEAVPLMWWEKPDEVKPPEVVDSRDEILRADSTAYSAQKSKARKG